MSSSDIAVSVRGLSKSYTIAHQAEKHSTLAETLLARAKNPFKRAEKETFWALKDVNFDIKKGEVVGIIGRNGAGKSTLLKVLSRITEPTTGQIDLYGRVGSLLEVGTGFHPELTGRENIYLNGAILGIDKAAVKRQFDAIVDFAGVKKFLDTPVKRYSSGMYVRLAFAVAAHLEAEVLIVDEVLAVGDAEFQKKCMGKMGDVAKTGRTVFFVSHNMAAIENLCTRAILMSGGRVLSAGGCIDVVQQYLASSKALLQQGIALGARSDRSGTGAVKLRSFRVEGDSGLTMNFVQSGMNVNFVLGFDCPEGPPKQPTDIGISVQNEHEQMLFVYYASYSGQQLKNLPIQGEFRCRVPRLPLSSGNYVIGARVVVGGEEADWPRNGIGSLVVEAGDFWGTGSAGFTSSAPLLVDANWSVVPAEEPIFNSNTQVTLA